MSRKLTASLRAPFCNGLIEAVCLASICVVPIFFNPQSGHNAYQPYKFGFLRAAVILGLAASIGRSIRERGLADFFPRVHSGCKSPMLLALSVFALALVVSTALSVNGYASVWGSPETFGGLISWGAQLTLFSLIVVHVRKREQVERLVTLLLVTSFAVSAFAILQRFGWDPRFPKLEENRAMGTAGHPIYLGGYLLMLIPLTIWRLLTLLSGGERRSVGMTRTSLHFYGVILTTQIVAFFFAESRGPTVALIVVLLSFGVFCAAWRRSRRAIVAIAVVLLTGAVVTSIAVATLDFAKVPALRRFGQLQSVSKGVEVYRADMWKQALPIIFSRAPVVHPSDGKIDGFRDLRPWVGYGSETLASVLPFYYESGGDERIIENRFHDLVWDLWFSIGGIGLLAFLAFILFLFHSAFSFLGLSRRQDSTLVFWAVIAASTVGSTFLFARLLGAGFVGIGLLAGVVGGLLLYATGTVFLFEPAALPKIHPDPLLIIALLSAIAGHLIDTGFAFVTAPTVVVFWTCAALAVAATRGLDNSTLDARLLSESSSWRFTVKSGLLVSIGVIALVIATVHHYSFQSFTFLDLITRSLSDINGTEQRYSLLILPVLLFWIGASLGFSLDRARTTRDVVTFGFRTLVLAGALSIIFLFIHGYQIVKIGSIPSLWGGEARALEQSRGYERLILVGIGAILLLVALIGAVEIEAVRCSGSFGVYVVGAIVSCGAGVGIWAMTATPLRAAIDSSWAEALVESNRQPFSIAVYRRAVGFSPRAYLYSGLLAQSYVETAGKLPEMTDRQSYLAEAASVLIRSRQTSDLNRSSFYLAQVFLARAELTPEPMRRLLELEALTAANQALIFEPHAPPVAALKRVAEELVRQSAR